MRRNALIWGIPATLYLLFFAWYTNLGGPLTPEEIAFYMQRVEARDPTPERLALLREFMESDSGDDLYMVNLLDMREVPVRVGEVGPDESSADVMNRYMEHMIPELFSRACHPVIVGPAVAATMDVVGIEGAEDWTMAAIFRYRSRRDLLDIATDPAFQGKHIYKIAALEKTIAYPIEPTLNFAEPRVTLALILLVVSLGLSLRRASRES